MKFFFYILIQAVKNIGRYKFKSLFYFISLFIISFSIFSIFLATDSIEHIYKKQLLDTPDITVQNLMGGKQQPLSDSIADSFLEITGVEKVTKRYWGYYIFDYNGAVITIIGIDPYEAQFSDYFEKVTSYIDRKSFQNNAAYIGRSVKKMFDSIGYSNKAYLSNIHGEMINLDIVGVLDKDSFKFADTIIIHKDTLKNLIGISDGYCSDIVLKVPNKQEIPIVVSKIKDKYPYLNIITKIDMEKNYSKLFFFEKGFLMINIFVAIIMIIVINIDRMVGIGNEIREIGILRALGWPINAILKLKIVEAFLISTFAFFISFIVSILYIFYLDAPLLKGILLGFSELRIIDKLPIVINISSVITVFLFITIPFILSSIFPIWKGSVQDIVETGVK